MNSDRMRRGGTLRILPWTGLAGVAVMVAMSSCSSGECFENKNSLPLAGFYGSGEKPEKIALDSISILGVGAPGDSILQDSVRGLSQSYLPFRIDQGSTTYEIRYLFGEAGLLELNDIITFNYDIEPWFVSSACGVSYRYVMKSIETTHNFIDSVTCPAGVIDNMDAENIRIYFRTSVSGEEEGGEE